MGTRDHAGAAPSRGSESALLRRLGADPDDVLSWLSNGDPLGVEARCAARLRERRHLVDPETCHLRAAARVALSGAEYDAGTPLEDWITARIDEAIDELLERDRRELAAGFVPMDELEPRFAYLRDVLGIETSTTLAAAVAFNDLPLEDRDGFFALCIEGRSVEECLAAGMGPPDLLRERTNRALDTIAKCAWGDEPGAKTGGSA